MNSKMYVGVWVANDQSGNDADPTADGVGGINPGSGVLVVHAEAFGPLAIFDTD